MSKKENIGKQFGDMKNRELIQHIEDKLKTKFDDIHLEETTYLNEESSSFSARFKIGDNSIIFVKDRGYIEVEILKEGEYTLIENLNKELNDLKFSLENIDRIIEFLGRIKYWINYCADEE
ncbi:hypothetical protein [Arenibacter algicola]|uniref:hypothetical protein n=1 Tax=Arenibacter algicola TaxID=616991 RepID=UPI0012FDB373|nr:hypothetical protein [Arenibacter algicola]